MDLQPLKIDRGETARPAPSRRRPRWMGPLVVFVLLGVLLWVFHRPVLALVDRFRLPEVSVMRVSKTSAATAAAASGTSANGYVIAKTRAALSADTPGRIVQMNVEEGSVVKRGDVVARLYSEEYAAFLRRAEADLALAEAGLERSAAERTVVENDLGRLRSLRGAAEADLTGTEAELALAEIESLRAAKLLAEGVGSIERRDATKSRLESATAQVSAARSRLESAAKAILWAESQIAVSAVAEKEARARVEAMKATRDQARATLEKTEVRAPFDGIVVLKDAEVGEVVSPNVQGGSSARGSVVTMVDFASLEVQAEVPETSLAAVEIGRGAKVYLDAFPEKAYPARVDRIWPTANRTKATVEVRVAFLERDERLRPEMGVRVVFEREGAQEPVSPDAAAAEPVVLIPAGAIVRVGGESGVFVLERDRVNFRKISLGAERASRRVVSAGLSEGETIVLSPPDSLEDGDRVRVGKGS
ncbi:MAG: efflux RND transporter periplasmic adaptor subunit [Planctomycetota bacterium]